MLFFLIATLKEINNRETFSLKQKRYFFSVKAEAALVVPSYEILGQSGNGKQAVTTSRF